MKKLGLKFLLTVVIVFAANQLIDSVEISGTGAVIGFAIVFLLINMTVKPIVLLISIPVTILTIGLFSLVINTWMVMLSDTIINGVTIGGFWNSFVIALTFSLLNGIFVYNKT